MQAEAAQRTEQPALDVAARLRAASGFSLERLPLIRDVFAKAAGALPASLARFSTSPVEVGLAGLELRPARSEPAGADVVAAFRATEWKERVTVAFDRALVSAMVDALFGGEGSEVYDPGGRPLSGVEYGIARLMADETAKVLQAALPAAAATGFAFESLALVDRTSAPVAVPARLVAMLGIDVLGHAHEMHLAVPQSVLASLRSAFQPGPPAEEDRPRDPQWTQRMGSELKRAGVTVRAVIQEPDMTLGDVAALRVGQVLPLKSGPATRVRLESADQPLFWCELGQGGGAFTLRIESAVDQDQEFLDAVLHR